MMTTGESLKLKFKHLLECYTSICAQMTFVTVSALQGFVVYHQFRHQDKKPNSMIFFIDKELESTKDDYSFSTFIVWRADRLRYCILVIKSVCS